MLGVPREEGLRSIVVFGIEIIGECETEDIVDQFLLRELGLQLVLEILQVYYIV